MSIEKRCGSCVHWNARERFGDNHRECSAATNYDERVAKAFVLQGDGYGAAFYTSEDFSCLLWERAK